jgi:hypothetical protein
VSYKLADVRAMSDEDVIASYDRMAEHLSPGAGFFLDEIARRDGDRQNQEMTRLTKEMHGMTEHIRRMTWVMTGATIVAVLLSVVSLIISLRQRP